MRVERIILAADESSPNGRIYPKRAVLDAVKQAEANILKKALFVFPFTEDWICRSYDDATLIGDVLGTVERLWLDGNHLHAEMELMLEPAVVACSQFHAIGLGMVGPTGIVSDYTIQHVACVSDPTCSLRGLALKKLKSACRSFLAILGWPFKMNK